MKKVITFLLTMCMSFALVLTGSLKEAHAQTITSNQTVSGTTDGNTYIDYVYTMPAKGYFYYTLQITSDTYTAYNGEYTYSSSGHDIYTSLQVNYKNYIDDSYVRGGSPFTSGYYSFYKGAKVKLRVRDYNGCSCHYSLTVHYVQPKYSETESNNSRAKADALKLKKTYTGICIADDVDWYKFTAPKKGKYKVLAVITEPEDYHLYYNVYKGSKRIQSDYRLEEGDGWKNVAGMNVSMKKGQKLYVKVTDGASQLYQIKITKVK